MNVNTSSSFAINSNQGKPPKIELNDEQKQLITETLAEYEAESLTQEQAQQIVGTFSQAGIQPSKALAEAMSEAGFDAKNVGDLAGVERPARPPQQSEEVPLSEMVDYIADHLAQTDSSDFAYGELSDQAKASLYQALSDKFGLSEGSSLIDIAV